MRIGKYEVPQEIIDLWENHGVITVEQITKLLKELETPLEPNKIRRPYLVQWEAEARRMDAEMFDEGERWMRVLGWPG